MTWLPIREVLDRYPALKDVIPDTDLAGMAVQPLNTKALGQVARAGCDDSCWAKAHDIVGFHALLPDGTWLRNFVPLGVTLGNALRGLAGSPVLVVRVHYTAGPTGPACEGYQESHEFTVHPCP